MGKEYDGIHRISFMVNEEGIIDKNGYIVELDPSIRGNVFRQLLEQSRITGSASAVLIKKDCFDQIGLFDEELQTHEDWDMWLRIAKARYRIVKNRYETVQYTVKDTGMASKNNEIKRREFLKYHPDADPK